MTEELRRNPKRKASEIDGQNNTRGLPNNLLEEALIPLTSEDIDEWEGWVELESEPAFFNIILRNLGVQGVKAQELFTIDPESLHFLPQPVHGLIFLFQYSPTIEEPEDDEATDQVWFANQTTHNACATVALLNIVMNAPEEKLGPELRSFKASTIDLNTALRGDRISVNHFIRKAHNALARRMDVLNADLSLENEVAADEKAKRAARSKTKGKRSTATRNVRRVDEYGFHFIAYVPAGDTVWELDGLRSHPHELGNFDSGDWTALAQPHIEARMLQYEENQLSFNLLALCESPLATLSLHLAQALASLRFLKAQTASQSELVNLFSEEQDPIDMSDEVQLSEYGLSVKDVQHATMPESLPSALVNKSSNAEDVYDLYQRLITDIKATMGEYRAEKMALAEADRRVDGRKKEWQPALHKWMTKLAGRPELLEVLKNSA